MSYGDILATLMISIDLIAGVCYLSQGDIRRGIYWIAAAVPTGAVTY